jgi:hypothetical protein
MTASAIALGTALAILAAILMAGTGAARRDEPPRAGDASSADPDPLAGLRGQWMQNSAIVGPARAS